MPDEPEVPTADPPGFAAPQGRDALRLQQLAGVSAELGAADTMDAVIAAAVTHAARAIGASVSTLMLTEGEQLVLVAGEGLREGIEQRWATFGLYDRNPASESARTGRPVLLASVPEIEREYPVLRNEVPAGRSLVCLPLDSSQPSVGVIGLTFEAGWLPGPNEMYFLTAYADACGQAVRRVRASQAARIRARQLTFLAQVSQELGGSLDYRRTLTQVAKLSVPELGDWCAVDIAQGGIPVTVAVEHVDPQKVRFARELQERYPPDPSATSGAAEVIRTGRSIVHRKITDEMLVAAAIDETHLKLTRELDLGSAIVVPLTARGRTLGTITLIRSNLVAPYDEADLLLAEDVGRRAGAAIDNAQLYEQTQDVALQLQRAVLPDSLDDLPDWEIATHYAPGGREGVGGDFYDAIVLDDGRLAFVIGDIMGHGVKAAAAMAQMRAAVRAYLCSDPDPAMVVGALDVMFAKLAIDQLTTLLYGVVDPSTARLHFVNAGHYPPILLTPDRAARFVETLPHLPLGAGGDERPVTTIDFGDDDTLLLYTDGLVEHRGEIIDAGLGRLRDAAGVLSDQSLQSGLDLLAAVMCDLDGIGEDDITAFAFRRRRSACATV